MAMFAEYRPTEHGVERPVLCRPAVEADIDACAALLARRQGEDRTLHGRRLAANLTRDDRELFVAERAGRVIGYASSAWLTPTGDGGRNAPDGWYLAGLVVDAEARRHGVGRALTRARLDRLDDRTDVVRYFCAAVNRASLRLHESFGFREATRDVHVPGVTFTGGVGVLGVRFRPQPSRTETRT